MPDRADGLGAVVDSLLGLDRDLDAVSIAEVLWLAVQDDSPSLGDGTTYGAGSQEDPDTRVTTAGQLAETDEAARRSPLHTPWEDGTPGPGAIEVSLPRNSTLPRGRELARALKPLKRPWRRGRRQRLDIPATVADYVRVGELTPVFSDEPERWFDATVVIDRSPTMAVWAGTADELVRLLARTGVFRTLRVRELYADGSPENTPTLHGPLGQRVVEGGGRSAQPRRLMLILSDWASIAWRDGSQWNQLRTWAAAMPTVLLNPLPSKIWRQTGMSLPAVRVVSPGMPGVNNAQLRFVTTLLMNQAFPGTTDRDWLPVPVNSLSPHAVGSWARALMLSDPAGCEALLLPAPGLVDQMVEQDEDGPRSGRSLTDAYLYRASPAAVRLAVLCSLYPQVSIDMLRAVQRSLVPEATPADLAEFVVGGLVTVTEATQAGGHPVLRFRDGTREQLMPRLGARDARRLRSAVDRFIENNSASPTRFPAAMSGSGAAGVPVDPEPFAEVSAGVLPALGLPAESSAPADLTDTTPTRETSSAESLVEPVPDPVPAAAEEPGDFAPSAPVPRRGNIDRTASPYFFLSYAHTPGYGGGTEPDMWVERLFQDLCGHVMAMVDLPAGTPVGFMDREIRDGEGWSERLADQLASCRVFVPLFSPRYFASKMCGQEWYAFEQRAIHHRARSNQPAEAIVPALWVPVPPDQLPDPAERLQFNHRYFGDRYASDGLYGLIKLRVFAEEYERAVYELAKRIVSVADTVRLDPGRPLDYRLAPTAFGAPSSGSGDRRPIQITVVAPTRRNLPEGRNPECYGDSAQDWNPYYPASARPLAHVTEDLVRSLNYQAVITSFDVESGRPGGRQLPDTPEILLIDRWALQDENRRRRLAAFDTENQPWATVIVPWNRHDGQSRAAEAELTETLEQTMPTKMRQGRAFARAAAKGVPSMEAFGQILPQVVEVAAQQYLRYALVDPPAGGRRSGTSPVTDRGTP
ncbi:TIR-like protein FxsC [Streptomyces sp. NPDC005571]|uniref:TIR-like protein FxsC n=1 Tax=Streptomyces sp. NPDC005571 TaxID=3156888 RepID=UPI0033B942E1